MMLHDISNPATLQQQSCYVSALRNFANSIGMEGLQTDRDLMLALVQWTKLAPSAIAQKAGVAATTVLRPYNGTATTRMSSPTLDKLRRAFPDFPGWLTQEPDLPSAPADLSYVAVNVLPSYAGMGGGGTGDADQEIAMLPRALIEDQLRGKPSDFELIDVRGDSMRPDFLHGDQILVDRRDRDPRQPGPFALYDGDGYVVKLVERVPGKRGWYRVFSANDRYTDYQVEETETTIMGRPVWFARRL